MSQIASNLDALRDIPGYKIILRTLIKTQIHLLMKQLSGQTGEESVILMGSINDGTLTHLSSDKAEGFYEGRHDVGEQFFKYLAKNFLRSNTNPPTQSGRSSQNKGPIPKKQKLFSPTYVVGNAQQTKQSCYRLPKKRPAGPGHRSQVWTPKLVCINDGKLSTNNLTAENCNQALLLAKDGTAAVPRPNIVPIPNQSKDFLPKPTVAPVSKTGEVPMARHPVTEQGKMLMGRLSENQGWPRNNSDIDTRVGIRPKMNTVYCVSLLNQESQKPNPLADPELENSESLKKAFNLTKPMEKQNHVPSPSSPVDLSTKDTSCSSSDPADYPRRDFNIKEEATKVLYRDYEKNTMSDTSKQGDEVTITSQNADLNSVKNFHKCKIGSGIMSDSDTTATVVSDTFATVGSDICADDISEGTETETDIDTTDDCRGSTVKASTDLISDKAVNERSTATDTEKVTDDKLAMLNDSTTGLDRARTVTKTTETVTQTTTGTCNGLENDRTSSLNTITKEIKDTCNDFATEFDDTLVVTDSIVNGDKENVSRMVESCSATSVTTYFKTSDSSAVGEENEAGTVKDHSNELESVSQRNDDRKGTTDEDLSNQLENAPKPNSNTETVKDKDLSNEIEISSKATCDSKSDEVIEMDKCKPINSKTSLSPESPEIMTDSNVPTVDITTSASMNICLEQKRNIDSSSDAKLRGPEDTTAKTAPGLKSVDVGLEKVELEKSSASKLKDIHFDIAAPGSVSAGVDVGIPKGSDLNTAVLDSAINYAASSLSEIETYTYVKDTKKTFGSVNVMSEVTIPNKNTASDANFTSLAADFNAHNLLNGNIPNSVSASLTIDKDSIATSTNLETVSGMVANMSPTNKGRNNKSPLLTDDENITSFIKLEPDDSSISEFIENLELQPMKMEDQENTVLKTPETVLEGTVNTSLNEVNEVRETANKISADGSNDDTIIVEIVEPAMDDTVDNGVRQIVPTGTIIMGSGGNQYIVGEGFDGNKIIGRSRGRPRKSSNKNPVSPFVRQANICSDGAFMISTGQMREELAKVKDCNKTMHDNDGAGKSPVVPPKVYKISLFGRKSNRNSENNAVDAAEKMGSNQAMEVSESGNKFKNSTANVSFIQNLKETTTAIESVPKDIHVSKKTVDTALDRNNKSDNEDSQEVSLVFHQRERVMTAFCDDSVFHKSAHTDMNNNNNNRVKNTGSETVFEVSENESNSRNSEKAKSKINDQVQNFQESKIGSYNKNSEKAKLKSSDQVQTPESIKTEPRTVSKASVYEALFKKCVISEGIKTYGSEFTSKHPELWETHVKEEPGLSECILIKQEPNTKANNVSSNKDDETSSTILSNSTDQFTNSYEELLYKRDNFDSTYRGDLNSNRTKLMRKRKVNDDTTLGQRTKKLKQSKVKIPKRLSVKNVPGNALFANFNEPTEVYTKPVSRKSSETVGLDVPMSTDAIKDSADIKKEPMEHCNGSLPKAARGRGRPRKTAGKQYQSQVSSLSETVELKRSAKLNYSSSKRLVDKVKVEPMDANDRYEVQKKVSDEVTETKEVFGDGDKASNYKFNGSKKTCKKKSMKRGDIDLDDSGKEGLNASEKSCVKTVKSGGKRANRKYVKEAIASGSLLICEECGKWFAFHSHLKNHLLLHSKELPYKCLVCLKRFRLRYQIQQHTRRMHPEVELPNKDLDMNDDSEIVNVKEEYED